MNYAHHEYLFDYRYKDLETGKLDIDKLTTLNSNTCLADMVEPGREPSYEYCQMMENQRRRDDERRVYIRREERSLAERVAEEAQREKDRIRLVASEKIRLEELEREMQEREKMRQKELVKLEEYRKQLLETEERLIKEKQQRLAQSVGGYSGQRIITSKWNVR